MEGWSGLQPAWAGPTVPMQQAPLSDALAQQQVDQAELQEQASRALRVLLGSDSVLPYSCLRLAVLGSRGEGHDSRSKCLLELVVASLVEQGLVVRQGYGPLASLSVPAAAMPKAEALAYSEFPDEGQLPLYSSSAGGGSAPPGGGLHRHPGSCLNRLARRLSSPRQFGGHRPMAGIEKAGGRRGKRGMGAEDLSSQLQKRMRMQDGGGGGPYSPGGLAAMSP